MGRRTGGGGARPDDGRPVAARPGRDLRAHRAGGRRGRDGLAVVGRAATEYARERRHRLTRVAPACRLRSRSSRSRWTRSRCPSPRRRSTCRSRPSNRHPDADVVRGAREDDARGVHCGRRGMVRVSASGRRATRFRRVAVARVHGTPDAGDVRLSRISSAGTVWTFDVETDEPYECDFTPESGSWLETEDGERYAFAAQAVGRDGSPGGPYVVVTRIEDDGVVPAADPVALGNAAGTPTGCELAGAIVIETFLSSTNALGTPLQHVCTLPVQTSTHPHPDGAALVGSPVGPVFTYTGRGAALNDLHGGEVGANGNYLPLPAHMAWSGGFEVVAA